MNYFIRKTCVPAVVCVTATGHVTLTCCTSCVYCPPHTPPTLPLLYKEHTFATNAVMLMPPALLYKEHTFPINAVMPMPPALLYKEHTFPTSAVMPVPLGYRNKVYKNQFQDQKYFFKLFYFINIISPIAFLTCTVASIEGKL